MKIRFMLLIGIALALLIVSVVGHDAVAEQKTIMLNLTQPIEAQKSSSATAKFAELTKEAMQSGMGDATVNGNIEYSMQPDRTIRSTVKWNSISIENGGKKVTQGLDESLTSKFRVPESKPRAEPGTKLKAMGDLDALAKSLGALKAQLDTQSTVVQKESTNNKTQSQAVAPVVSGQQADSSKYLSDTGNPFNTTVEASTTTTYEECPDRFIDTASMKAVKQYKAVYTKAGVKTGEGVCSANYSEFAPILKKDGTCTYRFDFANSTAIKEEQFYYSDGTNDINVGSCRDSSTLYPLTESRLGCPVTNDLANMKVFPQSKMVFTVGSLEQNATMCRPVSSDGIALQEEACEPMWEHDFVNNVSYLVTRMFYNSDTDGSKVYANQCGRSSTVSFPHFNDTSGCGWIMDDTAMIAYQQGKTIIRSGAIAGDVVVQDCHTVATVNYSFLGNQTNSTKFTTSGSFTFPAGVSSGAMLYVSAGQAAQAGSDGGYAGEAKIKEFASGAAIAGKTATFTIQAPVGSDADCGSAWPNVPARATTVQFDGVAYTANTPYGWRPSGGGCSNQNGYNAVGRFGINSSADYPNFSGLSGWGAGGPSSCVILTDPATQQWLMNGTTWQRKGFPGVVIFEYTTPRYMRPDGTEYNPLQ